MNMLIKLQTANLGKYSSSLYVDLLSMYLHITSFCWGFSKTRNKIIEHFLPAKNLNFKKYRLTCSSA